MESVKLVEHVEHVELVEHEVSPTSAKGFRHMYLPNRDEIEDEAKVEDAHM